ncbi:MAG TPA: hypothetical protein VFG03_22545 [Telluria sp.]|nr:hypothetical protein [Telluria sp.]
MRVLIFLMLALQIEGAAAFGAPEAPAPAKPPILDVSDKLIQDAVRATLAESKDAYPRRHEADTFRTDRYQTFAQAFGDARVPDCLHSDGLKLQPTGIGPVALGGLLALPFVGVAKLRGKCN